MTGNDNPSGLHRRRSPMRRRVGITTAVGGLLIAAGIGVGIVLSGGNPSPTKVVVVHQVDATTTSSPAATDVSTPAVTVPSSPVAATPPAFITSEVTVPKPTPSSDE